MDHLHSALLIIVGLTAGLAAGWFVGSSNVLKRLRLTREDGQRLATDAALAEQLQQLLHPPPKSERPTGVPLRLLTLLQRNGRFLDFVLENIQQATDAQIGAGVRELQPKWQETLNKHLVLEPVLAQEENSEATVPAGFDPSAIQLVGNVSGNPPFKGAVRHPGWRAKAITLPELPKGQDDLILMPAEVEIS